jgi:hypothetical protein
VTPFTYSLVIYPFIVLGLYLYASGRVGPGYLAILSGSGTIFLIAIHFGPTAVEPPADIIDKYEPRIVGWPVFGWLVLLLLGEGIPLLDNPGSERIELERTRVI